MNEDYNQCWMREIGFSQLMQDDDEKLQELTRKCIIHKLTQVVS